MIEPEVDHDFLKLPFAVDGAGQARLPELPYGSVRRARGPAERRRVDLTTAHPHLASHPLRQRILIEQFGLGHSGRGIARESPLQGRVLGDSCRPELRFDVGVNSYSEHPLNVSRPRSVT